MQKTASDEDGKYENKKRKMVNEMHINSEKKKKTHGSDHQAAILLNNISLEWKEISTYRVHNVYCYAFYIYIYYLK